MQDLAGWWGQDFFVWLSADMIYIYLVVFKVRDLIFEVQIEIGAPGRAYTG